MLNTLGTPELRSCVKVEVTVLGFPSLTVSVDVSNTELRFGHKSIADLILSESLNIVFLSLKNYHQMIIVGYRMTFQKGPRLS